MRVQNDIIGKNNWDVISLSEVDTIKILIRNRSRLDANFCTGLFNESLPLSGNSIPEFTEVIEDIYMDLERLIDKACLTDKQQYIVRKVMEGYMDQDISKAYNCSPWNISSIFNTACRKIKAQNDREWEEWAEKNGFINCEDAAYRCCPVCKKTYKVNGENFYFDKRNNVYKRICKTCTSKKYK